MNSQQCVVFANIAVSQNRKNTSQKIDFYSIRFSKKKSISIFDSIIVTSLEPRVKAEILNDFFASVFTVEKENDIPLLDTFLGEKLVDFEVETEEIKSKLCTLKVDKTAGVDEMSPCILKAVSEEIALPVAMVFHKSLNTGCVPRDWRCANVTPLFKKGSRHEASNYGHVSLTSQLCKVVESVFRDKITSSSSSCGLSRAGRCRSYELAPCLSILRSVVGGC